MFEIGPFDDSVSLHINCLDFGKLKVFPKRKSLIIRSKQMHSGWWGFKRDNQFTLKKLYSVNYRIIKWKINQTYSHYTP